MINDVDDNLYHSANNPHIKFAMYEDIEETDVINEIRNIAKQAKSIDVVFKSYSFYPNEQPFLNIDMAVSMELLRLQSKIRENCDRFSKFLPIDFFDRGIWKPDCQLTREIDKSKLVNAVNCLYESKLPIKGKIEKIGLIKFHPAEQIVNFEFDEVGYNIMDVPGELLDNLDELHTTELGVTRIKRNLSLETEDVVAWCKNRIISEGAVITRNGKNWYISIDACIITVNAHSYTIITAHKAKTNDA